MYIDKIKFNIMCIIMSANRIYIIQLFRWYSFIPIFIRLRQNKIGNIHLFLSSDEQLTYSENLSDNLLPPKIQSPKLFSKLK